jgi:hypothetical protein
MANITHGGGGGPSGDDLAALIRKLSETVQADRIAIFEAAKHRCGATLAMVRPCSSFMRLASRPGRVRPSKDTRPSPPVLPQRRGSKGIRYAGLKAGRGDKCG